jgi:hypothetical protein
MKFKRKNVKFEDFIFTQPKQLTPQFCEHLIDLFENHPVSNKHRNTGSILAGENNDIKQSEDINITGHKEFFAEDKILAIALKKLVHNYITHLRAFNIVYGGMFNMEYEDSGFQLQKTTPGGFYDWHHDGLPSGERRFTYLFYLNDVNHKGETHFANGLKVKPKKGKGLMFPASWEYVHRGIAPKDEIKYIATGWISQVNKENSLEKELEFN